MYKVAIIGAGVIGGMIARRLSSYDMDIAILEKEQDVAMGQSKANSGIVHAGYDPTPGSLKAILNVQGNQMMEQTCKELGVGYRKNGAIVVGFNEEDLKNLKNLYQRGKENGVEGLEILNREETLAIEKNLSENVKGALYAKTSAVVCPYELTINAVGNAMDNGAELIRNFQVCNITEKNGKYVIEACDGRSVEAEYVINCAGIYADEIARMVGDNSFTITARAGEYMLLDKEASYLTDATIFKVPDAMGKGVLATRTVDGNILLGPTSVDIDEKDDCCVTFNGLETVKIKEKLFFDNVPFDKVITQFTGLRAHGNTGDFIINSPKENFVNVAGIESPGLTSAPAIAVKVEEILNDIGFSADKKESYNPCRASRIHFSKYSPAGKDALIKENADYGQVICRCEEVTKAEIVEAIRKNPGAVDVDGIKRRTRSGMGRCQGGFCMPQVLEILAEELNLKPEEITKKGGDSQILFGTVKGGEQ